MAAPSYSVNSISVPGVISSWERVPKRKNNNGVTDYQDYAINTWDIEKMNATVFEQVQALRGAVLTSLATNDIDDQDNGTTYTSAEMVSLTNGQHVGTQIKNVRLEFRVKVV